MPPTITDREYSSEDNEHRSYPLFSSQKFLFRRDSYRNKYFHNSKKNPSLFPCDRKRNHDNEDNGEEKILIRISGNFVTEQYNYCADIAMELYKKRKWIFKKPILEGLNQSEWVNYRASMQKPIDILLKTHSHVETSVNGVYIGGVHAFLNWVSERYKFRKPYQLVKKSLRNFVAYTNVFPKLYNDVCPKTCDCFLRLCRDKRTGLTGTPIHRVVKDCWFEAGGYSIPFEETLSLENFVVKHDRRGVLSLSNLKNGGGNCTQISVTFSEQNWMNGRYVAIGQLIFGERLLTNIEKVETRHDYPNSRITIARASIFGETTAVESENVTKKTINYLNGHVEDVAEFIRTLLKEIIQHVPDQDFDESTRTSSIKLESQSRMTACTSESSSSRLFYLPFQDVVDEEDWRTPTEQLLVLRSSYTRPISESYKKAYRKNANRIMKQFIRCKSKLVGSIPHHKHVRDSPLQKLYRKIEERFPFPTLLTYRKRTGPETYFTKSTLLLPYAFDADSDSDEDRKIKRKHKLNEVGFSRMALLYDKDLIHRKHSFTYFGLSQSKSNLSREVIRRLSIRVHEHTKHRPCLSMNAYIRKNRVKRFKSKHYRSMLLMSSHCAMHEFVKSVRKQAKSSVSLVTSLTRSKSSISYVKSF